MSFHVENNLLLYLKQPRLAMVRFSNGPDHSKTEQNGSHLVLPFENQTPSTIRILNAFGI